jgi:uncharacterized membrane protein YccC
MSQEYQVPPEGKRPQSDDWQEIGRQFQTLGESLARAVRSTWEEEETQKRVQEMRAGLESMAREVGQAIEDTANSPQGQQFRQEATHTAESLRAATEETVQEVRPQIINALQQLNVELQKLVGRMEQHQGYAKNQTPPEEPPAQASTSQEHNENLF